MISNSTVRPTRFYSNKQEKRVAKAVGGRQTSNSGATAFSKGDVTVDNIMLIECKTVTQERNSFSIKRDWLVKNEEEKFAMGYQYSTLAFDFGDGEQHYIINERLFKILMNHLKNEGEDNK